jgi:hypothetical protein
MAEYIYPTRTNSGDEWLRDMLDSWKGTGRRYLCFPWITFRIHTIRDQSFWLYMYYSRNRSDIPDLIGVVEYRLSIVDWSKSKFLGNEIHIERGDEPGTLWFLVDRFEVIRKVGGNLVGLNEFRHADGKRLGSAIRNSIPPVVLQSEIIVIDRYP